MIPSMQIAVNFMLSVSMASTEHMVGESWSEYGSGWLHPHLTCKPGVTV